MKYSFMSFSCPELSLTEMLEVAARWGYAGLEPRVDQRHAHGIETSLTATERQAIKAQVADSPVDLGCLASSARYSDPDTVQTHLDATRRELDLAADLGIPALRVFGGQIAEGIGREAAIANLAHHLGTLAEQAAACGVTICLETHDDWCNPHHVVAVLEQVNHPRVAANWDVLHPVRAAGMTLGESMAIMLPWTRHVHMHDADLTPGRIRYVPMGTGSIDHREVLRGLQDHGFEGYMSGEWIGYRPWREHLPSEIRCLRGYEDELAQA